MNNTANPANAIAHKIISVAASIFFCCSGVGLMAPISTSFQLPAAKAGLLQAKSVVTTAIPFYFKSVPLNIAVLYIHVLAERFFLCFCFHHFQQAPVELVSRLRLFFLLKRINKFDSVHATSSLPSFSSALG